MPLVLAAVSPTKIIIVALAVLVQYVLSMVAFVKMSKAKITIKNFIIWNVLIVFVFYIGPVIAIMYSIKKVKKDGSLLDDESSSQSDEKPNNNDGNDIK